jgi:hypothetical protein
MNHVLWIASLLYRFFMLLLLCLFLLVKANSMTGFYYIDWSFYIIAAVPILSITTLTLYQNWDPKQIRSKLILWWISIIALVLSFAFQALLSVGLFTSYISTPEKQILWSVCTIFLFATLLTLLGLLKKQI